MKFYHTYFIGDLGLTGVLFIYLFILWQQRVMLKILHTGSSIFIDLCRQYSLVSEK